MSLIFCWNTQHLPSPKSYSGGGHFSSSYLDSFYSWATPFSLCPPPLPPRKVAFISGGEMLITKLLFWAASLRRGGGERGGKRGHTKRRRRRKRRRPFGDTFVQNVLFIIVWLWRCCLKFSVKKNKTFPSHLTSSSLLPPPPPPNSFPKGISV